MFNGLDDVIITDFVISLSEESPKQVFNKLICNGSETLMYYELFDATLSDRLETLMNLFQKASEKA